MFERLKEAFIDATFGLVKQYQEKTIELAKLEAAAFYIRSVKAFRRQFLIFMGMIFCTVVFAMAIVVMPLVLIMIAPINSYLKVALVMITALLEIIVPALYLIKLTSEESWLKLTRSHDLLENIVSTSKDSSNLN